jgi:hypothetical protein
MPEAVLPHYRHRRAAAGDSAFEDIRLWHAFIEHDETTSIRIFMTTLYSIIESSAHPNFTELYRSLDISEHKITSMRKAIAKLVERPDFVVAEFFYGYGNNYAGVNISNLDVMLYSLQKYSPDTRVIVLVDKHERQHVDKLNDIIRLHAILTYPFDAEAMRSALTG